jgi:3-oxoacyl-[acyl-carrier protein] reductase
MADRYQQLMASPAGRLVLRRVGLPEPVPLRRYEPGQPALEGPALLGAAPGGRLGEVTTRVLGDLGAATAHGAPADEASRFAALIFDASAISGSGELRAVFEFFHPVIRRLSSNGRLLVLGTPPDAADGPRAAVAQRALEGFVRSAGKEVGRSSTAQLIYVSPGAETNLASTLRFFLSAKSAYVSGQVVRIGAGESAVPGDWDRPLSGRTALVTGAARGIGEAIAATLARDGAQVVCLDVPAQGTALTEVANSVGGSALQLDITDGAAPATLAEHLAERHGGVDVVVHNAGITRDKTIGRMSADQWEVVLAVNLSSQERINDALLERDVLRAGGRVVCVSSVSGIAGNRGQANYATSKAGVIGMVDALAPLLAARRATINAVAPGFIETQMTAAMPLVTREAGRRLNSVAQGGLPIDVAETIAWLASPASGGVNGNVVRVCGQSLLGA